MALALEKVLDGPVMHGGSQLLGREDGGNPYKFSQWISYFVLNFSD
jgi:hypothetical protein